MKIKEKEKRREEKVKENIKVQIMRSKKIEINKKFCLNNKWIFFIIINYVITNYSTPESTFFLSLSRQI